MTNLIMPATVASQLQGLPHAVNLLDAAGKTLGCFVPAVDLSLYEIEGGEPTEEELREIERSTEWYSTKDVMRRLEKLQ